MAFCWDFSKYHGHGNDFLVGPDGRGFTRFRAAAICDRQRGVGADGLVLVGRPGEGSFPVRIFNADGSPATFSGNGIRAAAEFLFDRKAAIRSVRLVPPAGPVVVTRRRRASVLTFDTGALRRPGDPLAMFRPPAPLAPLCEAAFHVVLGNPHVVLLVPDVDWLSQDFVAAADELRKPGKRFPDAVNVSAVSAMRAGKWRMRTWERGVGLSPSCASAACAVLFGAHQLGLLPSSARFIQDGGELRLQLDGTRMTLEGPIEFVFRGQIGR